MPAVDETIATLGSSSLLAETSLGGYFFLFLGDNAASGICVSAVKTELVYTDSLHRGLSLSFL